MLVLCHPHRLTPSAPLGADWLIGGYCSTCESEEGRLRPLPPLSGLPISLLIFGLLLSNCSLIFWFDWSVAADLLLPSPSLTSPVASLVLPLACSTSSCICRSRSLSPFHLRTVHISISFLRVRQANWQVTFFAPPSVGPLSNFTLLSLSSLLLHCFLSSLMSPRPSVSSLPSFVYESFSHNCLLSKCLGDYWGVTSWQKDFSKFTAEFAWQWNFKLTQLLSSHSSPVVSHFDDCSSTLR